jgi:hypothetical protein
MLELPPRTPLIVQALLLGGNLQLGGLSVAYGLRASKS